MTKKKPVKTWEELLDNSVSQSVLAALRKLPVMEPSTQESGPFHANETFRTHFGRFKQFEFGGPYTRTCDREIIATMDSWPDSIKQVVDVARGEWNNTTGPQSTWATARYLLETGGVPLRKSSVIYDLLSIGAPDEAEAFRKSLLKSPLDGEITITLSPAQHAAILGAIRPGVRRNA